MNQKISEQIHLQNKTDLKLHLKLYFMFIIEVETCEIILAFRGLAHGPHCRDQIKWFGIANYESFFIFSGSNTILLELFHKPYITHMFQKRIIRFSKLIKLQRKWKPKGGLLRLLLSLLTELVFFIELAFYNFLI